MFRFSIRDVLWLTVVVALGVGWWVERVELSKLTARVSFLEHGADLVIEQMGEQYETVSITINGQQWPRESPTLDRP